MRIEINAGGLGGVLAVHDYLSDINTLTQKSNSVIASFATVKNAICNVTGGLGNLSEAVSMLNDRMQRDEQDKIYLYEVKNESQTFLDLAKEVDRNVEKMLNQSRKQFFAQNPWLKPQSNIEKWANQAWSWICKGTSYIYGKANDFVDWCAGAINKAIDYAKAGWEWTKDTLSKAWNNVKTWYDKNKEKIWSTVKTWGWVVVGAACLAITLLTGGAAAVGLAPLLSVFMSAEVATSIGVTLAVAGTALSVGKASMQTAEIWNEDLKNDEKFQGWKNGVSKASEYIGYANAIGSTYKFATDISGVVKHTKNFTDLFTLNKHVKLEMNGETLIEGVRYLTDSSTLNTSYGIASGIKKVKDLYSFGEKTFNYSSYGISSGIKKIKDLYSFGEKTFNYFVRPVLS